jgi:hypothetical protein
MQIWSGLQGSGTRSDASNTPPSARRRRRPDRVERWTGGIEAEIAAGVLDRLENDAAHARPAERVVDDRRDLVVVHALADGTDQGGRDAGRLEPLERLAPDPRQPGAAQLHQCVVRKRIELEIDFEARPDLRQSARQSPAFLGDPDAIGVDHDVADRPAPRAATISQNRGWMVGSPPESWTGRLALGLDHRVEHRLDLGERLVAALADRAVGEADRAGQVAGVVDLDDGEAASAARGRGRGRNPRAAALGPAGVEQGRSPGFSQRRMSSQ